MILDVLLKVEFYIHLYSSSNSSKERTYLILTQQICTIGFITKTNQYKHHQLQSIQLNQMQYNITNSFQIIQQLNSSLMEHHSNRFHHIQMNRQKVEFVNNRRQFDLDRIIKQYQAQSQREEKHKQSITNHKNIPIFALNHSDIKSPLKQEPKITKYKRPNLQLRSLQPQTNKKQLDSHLKLKILSTRYNQIVKQSRRQAKSVQFSAFSSLTPENRQTLESIRMKAKNKHSSLVSLDYSKNVTKTKQSKQKNIKWGHRTRKGYNPNDPHKPNQDEYIIKWQKNKNRYLFAVADGHGPYGHLVSQFAMNGLQSHISQQSNENIILSLNRVYNKIQDELFRTNIFDVSLSGTTLNTIVVNYPKLICANVGDSRSVMVRKCNKNNWEVVHISEDHKPSLPKERKRILKKGGKVYAFRNEQGFSVGPLRVWLPHKNSPGLAMSRSLGDNLCKSIGVTHEPQVVEMQVETEDKFIIIGSDGVWQSITTSQILNFLVPLYNQGKLQQCCDTLLQLCVSSALKNANDPIDDITFIIVFLNKPQ